MRKIGLVLLCLVVLPLILGAQQTGKKLDEVIAVVGDEPVLRSEFESIYSMMALQSGIDQIPDSAQRALYEKQLKQQVLDEIIKYKLFYVAAKRDTAINITEQEVDDALNGWIEQLKSQTAQDTFSVFDMLLNMLNMDENKFRETYRWFIKLQLYSNRYIQSHIAPNIQLSPTELDSLYNVLKDSLVISPENVRVSHILVRIKPSKKEIERAKGTAQRIYKKIKSGEDFASMASRYSDDVSTAAQGGYLGNININAFNAELSQKLSQLKPGEMSEPLELPDGFHIFKCISKDGDQMELAHILVKFNLTKADTERARKKAEKIMKELEKGASFDSLATVYSDDESTKDLGGDIGWVPLNLLPKSLQDTISTMKVGDIKGPILSEYGFHIVKLNDRVEKQVATKEQFAQFLKNQKLSQAIDEEAERLRNEIGVEIKVKLDEL